MATSGERLLADPSVRAFLASGAFSMTGISLMLTVLFKQAYDLTNDPLTIGLIGLAQFVPAVLLVVVSGDVADRFDRRHVVALMSLGRVVCAVGFLVFTLLAGDEQRGTSAVWPLLALTIVFGSFDAIAIPARHALAPLVVERRRLPHVSAARASTMVVATIAGPVIGGFVYDAGPELAYGVTAVLFAASIPATLRIRYAVEQTRLTERPSLRLALEGLGFIRRSPVVLSSISLDMFAVLFGGAVALLPVIASERLGVGNVAYGWLRAAPGIGAAVTGLWLARRPVQRRVGPTLLAVVAVFGAFHIVLGITTSYAVAFAALVVAAGADMVSMTIRSTLVPIATPHDQLGRVAAVEGVFIGASNELGAFESGVAARWLGVPWAVAGGGAMTVAIVACFAAFVPTLRQIDTYDDVAPG